MRSVCRWRRWVVIVAATLLTGYVAVCVAIYAVQDRLIYFPNRNTVLTPGDVKLDFDNLTLTTATGTAIHAWYIPYIEAESAHQDAAGHGGGERPTTCVAGSESGSNGTVIITYGNASNMSEQVTTARTFHRLGFSVLLFDYPGFGRSGGTPSEAALYEAADAAWRYVTDTRGEAPGRVVLFGRSLGAAVAIEMAHRHTPGALIVESTFTSMVDMGRQEYPLLPVSWLCRHRYESVRKVPHIRCPKLFLHGMDDTLVPIDMARRLHAAAAPPKDFIPTPGGHNDSGFEYSHETTQAVAEWLGQALSLSQPGDSQDRPLRPPDGRGSNHRGG